MSKKNPRGAYGFAIDGVDDPLFGSAEPNWPLLRVVREGSPPTAGDGPAPGTVRVEDDRAEIWIGDGGRVTVDRATLTVTFATRERVEDRLVVHPYLALPASIASHWLGRQTLHGGAFADLGGAWALLGDKEAGKSSTLGWLAGRGLQILSDDILVLDDGVLLSGPRCVDLRAEAAAALGGEHVGMLGNRERWRLAPGAAPASAPLTGVVHLEWGDRLRIEELDPEERLTGLIRNSVIRPAAADAEPLLDLAALPTLRFVRPRDLSAIDSSGSRLLEALREATRRAAAGSS